MAYGIGSAIGLGSGVSLGFLASVRASASIAIAEPARRGVGPHEV